VNLRKIGVWLSLYDVVRLWLRQTPRDCIPHPYWIYKVFEHLEMLWMGIWVHPYTVMPVQAGVDFRKIGALLSPSPSDVVMSWLRLQATIDCILQPWHSCIVF
jgi:hypothetical protein